MPKITRLVITKSILNTCDPYIIKYPSPFFDTRSSPMITPIRLIEMLILQAFIRVIILLGKTALKNI